MTRRWERSDRPVGVLAGARILIAVTAPPSASFVAGQLAALRLAGAEVFFLSSPSADVERQCALEGAEYLPVPMHREPALTSDLRAFAAVNTTLARVRPDIVNAGTPKAGLLVMTAAALRRVPRRVHTLHGLRYEAARGAQRRALWGAQRLTCVAATQVLCVSHSLRDKAIDTGLIRRDQGIVLGDGTVNGIDLDRFNRGAAAARAGAALRTRLGVRPDQRVVGYLGRLAADKGIEELARSWPALARQGAQLLIGGHADPTDPPDAASLAKLRAASSVHWLGQIEDPSPFYAAIDVLVLPTHREGMPTVLLEAGAFELPVVATRATGCVDAVIDGATGTLVPVGDAGCLVDALTRYVHDRELCKLHGIAARARVTRRFSRERVHGLVVEFYRSLLARP